MAITTIKDTNFNMRMNKQKKSTLENLYASLGMTLAEAVNIFFEKSLLEGGIPFDVKMPRYNTATEEAINEARNIANGKIKTPSYESARELFSAIEEE